MPFDRQTSHKTDRNKEGKKTRKTEDDPSSSLSQPRTLIFATLATTTNTRDAETTYITHGCIIRLPFSRLYLQRDVAAASPFSLGLSPRPSPSFHP